jgi:hypothetical protein
VNPELEIVLQKTNIIGYPPPIILNEACFNSKRSCAIVKYSKPSEKISGTIK